MLCGMELRYLRGSTFWNLLCVKAFGLLKVCILLGFR
jgi:hypothetical protein